MQVSFDGLVLKRTQIVGGKSLLTVLTDDFGKITLGVPAGYVGKGRSSLGIKTFSLTRYDGYKHGNIFNMSRAQVIESFFHIGQDVEKFYLGSVAVELTDLTTLEGEKNPRLLSLLTEFMKALNDRDKDPLILLIAYELHLIDNMGIMPQLDKCGICGNEKSLKLIGISSGHAICNKCHDELKRLGNNNIDIQIWNNLKISEDFDIIESIKYLKRLEFKDLKNIRLKADKAEEFQSFIRRYILYHLNIEELKSDALDIKRLLNDSQDGR